MSLWYCENNGKIYFNGGEVERELNVNRSNLRTYHKGKGYTFRKLETEEVEELRNYFRNKPEFFNR